MNKNLNIFFGFIVGAFLMVMPIPDLFSSIGEKVKAFCVYTGFSLVVICGLYLIVQAVKSLRN